jgi:hypothetical protein
MPTAISAAARHGLLTEEGIMTVKELREKLTEAPDDAPVLLPQSNVEFNSLRLAGGYVYLEDSWLGSKDFGIEL